MSRLVDDDRGVAVVVGAILLTGLMVAGFVHVRINYVPIWEKENETEHMQLVEGRLLALRSGLESPFGNDTVAARTTHVPLVPGKSALTAGGGVAHRLEFQPDSHTIHVDSPRLLPAPAGVPNRDVFSESWVAMPDTLVGIHEVHNLRWRVDAVGPDGGTGTEVHAVARDADGRFAGNLTLRNVRDSGDYSLYVTVDDGRGQVLFDNPIISDLSNTIAPFWLDLLDPTYRFSGLLRQAPAPFSLQFSEQGLSADYAITYSTSEGTGLTSVQGGTGIPTEINRTWDSGRLLYQGLNQRYVRQELALENGALVLRQGDGAVFRAPPHFDVRMLNNVLYVSLSLPSLSGEPLTLADEDEAVVYLMPLATESVRGLATNFTISLSTPHPELWADHFRERFRQVPGLAEGEQFTIVEDEDDEGRPVVRLLVDGDSTSPIRFDTFLTLQHSAAHLELRA